MPTPVLPRRPSKRPSWSTERFPLITWRDHWIVGGMLFLILVILVTIYGTNQPRDKWCDERSSFQYVPLTGYYRPNDNGGPIKVELNVCAYLDKHKNLIVEQLHSDADV